MVGNPFSPWYAEARRRAPASALRFSAMNVAVYDRQPFPGYRLSTWALEERAIRPEDRWSSGLVIGSSCLRWEGDRLVVDLDERTVPFGHRMRRPLRGRVTLHPEGLTGLELPIDGDARQHRWWPVAPVSRIDVALSEPRVRFTGHGYYDVNAGDVPLERTFTAWTWSRARAGDEGLLTYDVSMVDGSNHAHSVRVARNGRVDVLEGTTVFPLPGGFWRLRQQARADIGARPRLTRVLEDGPFYGRSLVRTRLGGKPVTAMHETLAAYRLRERWVQRVAALRIRSNG